MPYGSHTTPTKAETWLENRLAPYRFGGVLVLLVITFIVLASGPTDAWARVVTVALEGLTLLVALLAARSGRQLFRIAAAVVAIGLLSAAGSLLASSSVDPTGWFFALNVLLVGAAPVAIGRSLYQRHVTDVHTVTGAVCIYMLIGMAFAFLYAAVNALGSHTFFAQTDHPKLPIFLYFSYVTQTTTGYGDYSSATNLGHALSVTEALIGQLYLVTVIAILVSRLSRTHATDRGDVERSAGALHTESAQDATHPDRQADDPSDG